MRLFWFWPVLRPHQLRHTQRQLISVTTTISNILPGSITTDSVTDTDTASITAATLRGITVFAMDTDPTAVTGSTLDFVTNP